MKAGKNQSLLVLEIPQYQIDENLSMNEEHPNSELKRKLKKKKKITCNIT